MAKWINRSLVQAPRNGTSGHTITFTAATAGNLLVLVLAGAVTHTVPTGWFRQDQALSNTELSVYTKTATAGESSFSTTHNGDDYPIAAVVYEFPAGATFVANASAASQGSDGANPQLSGLTGINQVFAAVDTPSNAQGVTPTATAWTGAAGLVEDFDVTTGPGGTSSTDGYLFSVAYVEDWPNATFAPTGTITGSGVIGKETLSFAVWVPQPMAALTGTFTTKDTATWFYKAGASVAYGQLNLVVDSAYSGYVDGNGRYDLTGSSATVELVQAPNKGNGSTEVQFVLQATTADEAYFILSNGFLNATVKAGDTVASSATFAYSATAHRWLRIREAGGVVFWETSPDRATWTIQNQWTATWPVTSVLPQLIAGYWGTEPDPGTAIFDNFNVVPEALPLTETWTGTTGAAWPSRWTQTPGDTGSSATIQNNAGRIVLPSVSSYAQGPIEYLDSMMSRQDVDVTLTLTFSAITERYVSIMGRVSADTNQGYGIQVFPHNGTASVSVIKWDGAAVDLLADQNGGSWVAGTARKVRLQVIGNTIRFRCWNTGAAEPTTWAASVTDTSYAGLAGKVALTGQTGGTTSGGNVTFDDLTVTDGTATSVTVNGNLSGSGTLTATAVPLKTVSASLTGSGTLSGTTKPLATRSAAVSGSGTLTATAIHVASAALSGTGTLDADFGALSVNASLTGSGTLTATVFSIAVSPDLTGTGTLTATWTVPAYHVELSGSGQLDAVVTPKLTLTCPLGGSGSLTATSTYRVLGWIFRTPTQEVWIRLAGRGLVGKYDQGLSVYRVNGQWRTRLSPPPDELAAADRHFQGGYLHQLSDADRADLVAGGFADNITFEEVRP